MKYSFKTRLIHWLTQLFIAFDQFCNVFFTPLSMEAWADETVSSRSGRLGHRMPYKVWRWFIDLFIFSWWQGPNHCVNAYHKELTRYQFPPAMRKEGQWPDPLTTQSPTDANP